MNILKRILFLLCAALAFAGIAPAQISEARARNLFGGLLGYRLSAGTPTIFASVPYSATVNYAVGRFVLYSGVDYRKLTTAAAGTTPVAGTDWAVSTLPVVTTYTQSSTVISSGLKQVGASGTTLDARVRVLGGRTAVASGLLRGAGEGDTGSPISLPYAIEENLDSPLFDLYHNEGLDRYYFDVGNGLGLSLVSDGVNTIFQDSSNLYRAWDWRGVRQMRRFRMEGLGENFGRFDVSTLDTVWFPTAASRPTCLVLGDSYTYDTGGTYADGTTAAITPYQGWAGEMCRRLGWELAAYAVSGTGYLADGTGNYTGTGTRALRARITNDLVTYIAQRGVPSVLFVAFGYNDSGQSQPTLSSEAIYDLSAIRVLMQGNPVVVIGPWTSANKTATDSGIVATDTTLRTAALGIGFPYWSPVTGSSYTSTGGLIRTTGVPMTTGTGYQGATNGTGTSDVLDFTDGVHPNNLGHRSLGALAAQAAIDCLGLPVVYTGPSDLVALSSRKRSDYSLSVLDELLAIDDGRLVYR